MAPGKVQFRLLTGLSPERTGYFFSAVPGWIYKTSSCKWIAFSFLFSRTTPIVIANTSTMKIMKGVLLTSSTMKGCFFIVKSEINRLTYKINKQIHNKQIYFKEPVLLFV